MSDADLKSCVMQRVKFIHLVRRAFQPLLIEGGLIILAVFVANFWNSFGSVEKNASAAISSGSISRVAAYFLSTVLHADAASQAMMFIVVVISAAVAFNLFSGRNVFSYLSLSQLKSHVN